MGEKDIAEKTLESYNDVFADIANVFFFNGEQVIQDDELEDAVPYSMYKSDWNVHEQERDCAKFWKRQKICIAMCGFENQTVQDNDMPLRVIGYDGTAYRAELNDGQKERYPVITLVLYFGDKHWTANKRLKECFTLDKRLEPFVNDYKINVVEVSFLAEEQVKKFKSDFRIIADFFVQSHNGKYNPPADDIHHADEVFKLMSVLTGDKRFDETYNSGKLNRKNEEGGKEMCKVIDDFINEGIERGMQQGIEQGERNANMQTAKRLLDRGFKRDEVAELTNLTVEEVSSIR